MNTGTEGSLVFILFIPILWVLWLWVHIFCLWFTRANSFRYPSDDRLEARNYLPCLPSLL